MVVATPKDNGKRAWPATDRHWAAGKRQLIEQVIEQLKDLFALERHLGGLPGEDTGRPARLLARLAAKVAAYTGGLRLNSLLSRPLRHLADLLI